MRAQSKIFAKLVQDFMHAPKVCVETGTFCEDVISQMSEKNAKCCVVVDSHGKLAGILRMKDILDRVVFKISPKAPIDDVMDETVQTISADEYLYHAIGRMRRHQVEQIVVVDNATRPIGFVYLHEAIESIADYIIQKIDKLSCEGDVENLKTVKEAQVDLAAEMFSDGMRGYEIQHLITHVNNDIYARIVSETLRNMKAEGWGTPPVEFCVIVMGSGGRGENYLLPDQDNGFILDDYDDADHNRVDHFFRELSERTCRDLNEVGFTLCRGNVMARNPVWRKTISQWIEQVRLWGRKRNSVALRLADIFFDFQPVWGKAELADELRQNLLSQVKSNHVFLQEMFNAQIDHGVALGMFGRLAVETEDANHRGEIDLKYHGTLPLVEAVRLLSLQHGVQETSTKERISRLHERQLISDTEADYLSSALNFLTHLLLHRQIKAFTDGQEVSRYVHPKSLSKREKENLLNAFRHIDAFRKRLKAEFTGDVF